MKVIVEQDRKAAIRAGVEPVEQYEVEVDLQTLTPEQREKLAEIGPKIPGYKFMVIRGEASEIQAGLQAVIDAEIAEQIKRTAEQESYTMECLSWERTVVATPTDKKSEEGVEWSDYGMNVPLPYHHRCARPESTDRKYAELQAECERLTAEAQAAVQPQIDVARTERERKNQEQAEADRLAVAAIYARRLETGVVKIPITRNNRAEWGEPWIAKVTSRNGRKPDYDFSSGSYDTATATLSIPCKPGDVIAYGQKNYRKPKKTIHIIERMTETGKLISA
jgi:hypothetical protein